MLLAILSLVFCESYGTFIITDTHAGEVRGFQIPTNSGSHLNVFLGIPYAEAPVDSLRFAPPVEKDSWRPRILNATKFGPACPQVLRSLWNSFGNSFHDVQEDCLYLNIYAPKNASNPTQTYPVMVWIHGGYFQLGSGSEYDGRILASKGGVIVVTINYRLGALGFLSTDDSVLSGNQGVLDQVLALKWINKNIHNFGGNSQQVTLFGQSAGGASVSLHMFSPLSTGLFQGLISQSGCAVSPFAVNRPPHSQLVNTRNLALMLGCPVLTSKVMVNCLRHKSVEDIVSADPPHPQLILAYAPRVDGYFLHDVPENLIKTGNFNRNIRVMMGYVRDESSIFIPSTFDEHGGYDVTLYDSLLTDLSAGFLHSDKVKSTVMCYYPGELNNTLENADTYMNLVSDFEFKFPHMNMASSFVTKGIVTWLYEFSYLSPNYPGPKWRGVYHSSELFFLFGAPLYSLDPCPGDVHKTCPQIWETIPEWDHKDRKISETIIDLWSQFAKMSSHEISISLYGGSQWGTFNKDKQFLFIGNSTELRHYTSSRTMDLWDKFDFLDYYVNPDFHCNLD